MGPLRRGEHQMTTSSTADAPGAVPPAQRADETTVAGEHDAPRQLDGGRPDLDGLFRDNGAACYQLARGVLRDSQMAEDVVQEVFLQHWHQAGRFDPRRSSVRGWLLMLTYRKAVDRVRHEELRRVSTLQSHQDQASAERGPEAHAVASALGARVRRVLGTLPEAQRQSIALAYWGGYTQREIADMTDAPLGTVKTRMRSGLLTLRAALAIEHEESS